MKVKLKVVHHNYSKRLKIHKKLHQEKFLKDVYMLYFHHKMYVLAYTSEKVCKQKAKDEIMASHFCSYDKSGPKCVLHMTKHS